MGAWWRNAEQVRASGILLGAYWVLYPGNPAGRADTFLARLDAQCPGWRDGPFILQADCEQWGGNPATVPGISEINAFCDRLVERMPKLNPVVYAPKWVYGDRVSALRYPIWASSYVIGAGHFLDLYPGDGAKQWAPYGGKSPSILQYTSSATIGGQTTCDANAFRGTPTQLHQLIAPGWSTVTTLDTDDLNKIAATVYQQVGRYFTSTTQIDGTPTSSAGVAVWSQGIPDATKPQADGSFARSVAWQSVLNGLVAASAKSTEDPTAVASALIEAGIGLDVARAMVQLLTPPAS